MILFYGMGGGFGHLTRIQAFIKTYKIKKPYLILTANPSANSFFRADQLLWMDTNKDTTKEELAEKIRQTTSTLHFDHLYIDTFPQGILGELTRGLIKTDQTHYLVRRLIWTNYKGQVNEEVQFDKVYRFETLEFDHQEFLNTCSKEIIDASLAYTSPDNSFTHSSFDSSKPIWLITHTTYTEELGILIDHAKDIALIEKVNPQLVILSDVEIPLPDSAILLQDQNPIDWYPKAEKIFSAAGFNTWHQLKPFREKHIAIPFKRKFDDQFWRASKMT